MTFFGGYYSDYKTQISDFENDYETFYLKKIGKLSSSFRNGLCYTEPISKKVFLCFDDYSKSGCKSYYDGDIRSEKSGDSSISHSYAKMIEFDNGLIVVGGTNNKMIQTYFNNLWKTQDEMPLISSSIKSFSHYTALLIDSEVFFFGKAHSKNFNFKTNSHGGGMAVALPYGFEIDFGRKISFLKAHFHKSTYSCNHAIFFKVKTLT